MKDYFNLSGYDGKPELDIGDEPLTEESEFAPHSYAQTGADNGVPDSKPAVPTAGKASLEGGEKGPSIPQNSAMPGETQVKSPSGGGEMGPKIPQSIEITSDAWKASMQALQKSFKEGIELMQMLESCRIVDKTPEQKQQEYMEDVMVEAVMTAYEDGPLFEAVDRDDKNAVKKIVRSLRPKVKKQLKEDGVSFYESSAVTKALIAVAGTAGTVVASTLHPLLGAAAISSGSLNGAAALFQQLWNTRLWQIVGVVHLESGNISNVMNELTEQFKEELGEYKFIHFAAVDTIVDTFKKRFGWKNTKNTYFILIDKKLPSEVKEAIAVIEKVCKEGEKNGDGKKEDTKPVKESSENDDGSEDKKCPKCGKNPCECGKNKDEE